MKRRSLRRSEPDRAVKTAALITHSHPPAATEAVAIADRGRRARPAGGWSPPPRRSPSTATPPAGVEPVESLPADPDLCLVLGGDGSILYALRRYRPHRRSRLRRQLRHRRLPRRGRARRGRGGDSPCPRRGDGDGRPARLSRSRSTATVSLAFNDVSFSRRPEDRVAELSYRIAGEEVGNVRCDGLVAATPAGSTGYNLANQGPILAWGVKGYVVSYIAPHSLTARALVVAPGDVLTVGNAAGREPVDVAIDGAQARQPSRPELRSTSASSTPSASWPSSPARASTTASARSSATWRSRRPTARCGCLGFRPWSASGGPWS